MVQLPHDLQLSVLEDEGRVSIHPISCPTPPPRPGTSTLHLFLLVDQATVPSAPHSRLGDLWEGEEGIISSPCPSSSYEAGGPGVGQSEPPCVYSDLILSTFLSTGDMEGRLFPSGQSSAYPEKFSEVRPGGAGLQSQPLRRLRQEDFKFKDSPGNLAQLSQNEERKCWGFHELSA